MKMCLAPCFAGCTAEEYAREVSQVVEFLSSGGASLSQELTRERETASSELDFERAAAQHRRLEKVDAVRRGMPEFVRRLDRLDAVILERASEKNTIAAFLVRAGRIADPFLLRFDELASQPRSAEEILRGVLQPADGIAGGAVAKSDRRSSHRRIRRRWGRRSGARGPSGLSWRVGFMAGRAKVNSSAQKRRPDGWPYRRMLRACARLLAPRDAQAPP